MKRGCIWLFVLSLILFLLALPLIHAEELKVTSEHPFLMNGKWIPAYQLKIGDKLKTIDGKTARITNIEKIDEQVEVYNLEASPYNDFVAGNEGVVVHNSKLNNNLQTFEESLKRSADLVPDAISITEGANKQVFIINIGKLRSLNKFNELPQYARQILSELGIDKGIVVIKLKKPKLIEPNVMEFSLMNEADSLKKIQRAIEEIREDIGAELYVSPRLIKYESSEGLGFIVEEGVSGKTLTDIGQMYNAYKSDSRAKELWSLIFEKVFRWMTDSADYVFKKAGISYIDYTNPRNMMIDFIYQGRSYTFEQLVKNDISLNCLKMDIRFVDFDTAVQVKEGMLYESAGIRDWSRISFGEQRIRLGSIFSDATIVRELNN